MAVMNQIDRFNLAIDVIDRVPRLQDRSGHAREWLKNKLIEHRIYVRTHGQDLPEVRDWQWGAAAGPERTTDQAARTAPEA
jgi:xylulose-5-phosphate/fructose-6-phosphate phosphoketolase